MTLGTRRNVNVHGCRYATWRAGRGPLVVLLHGWPVTSRHWRAVVPHLVRAGLATLCIDLRGLGESRCKADGRFAKATLARDLKAVLRLAEPGLRGYFLVGHDWGGSVAVALAAIDSRVQRLVVEEEILPGIEATIPEPGASRYPSWHGPFHRLPEVPERVITGRERAYIGYFLGLRYTARSLSAADRAAHLGAYRGLERTKIGLAYYRTAREDRAFFTRLRHQKLRTPLLAVGGRSAMGPAVGDCMAQICTRVTRRVIEKCGHYPAEERPQEFAAAVVACFANSP